MTRLPTWTLLVAIAASSTIACTIDTKLKGDSNGGGDPSGGNTGPVSTTPSGMPCEIAQVLASQDGRCTSCHSSPPPPGIPMSLVTYADLAAPAPSDPTKSTAQVAVERMQATQKPMPPKPMKLTATEIQTFANWVNAGMPQADCSGPPPTPPPSIYDTPLTCSSGTNWTRGTDGSSSMKPGGACIKCHSSSNGEEAPRLTVGGTVYRTAHEPDDCNGTSHSVAGNPLEVQILDGNGQTVFTLPVNSAGNFYEENVPVPNPFTAKVVDTVTLDERAMGISPMTADCNSCHTVKGASDAPGRIMAP